MSEIHLSLPDSAVAFAGEQVASGRFSSVDDYFLALVHADQISQEDLDSIWKSPKLEKLLEEGVQSGSAREWDSHELDRLKQQLVERSARNRS